MSKHTPGPWHWESDEVNGDPTGRVRYQVTALGKTVTCVYYSSFAGSQTNAEADAKLISAAPELYEALERLTAVYQTAHSPVTRLSCWKQAGAALSKARGES